MRFDLFRNSTGGLKDSKTPEMSLHSHSPEEIAELQGTYQRDRVVTIPNFLDADYAAKIADAITTIADDQWLISIHPYRPNMFSFYNVQSNAGAIAEGRASAQRSYDRNEFSYVFYRKDKHGDPNCACDFCSAFQVIGSQESMDLIKEVTGEDVRGTAALFASRYEADCFLNTHTDNGRGKIAMVLNLTRDWNPEHGGCLSFLDWDYRTIRQVVNPTFNSLTLFYVVGQGTPHKVSRVASDATGKRIAISGWFV